MRVGRLIASLTLVAALVGAAVAAYVTGTRPLLGLDLVGGVSVVLAGPAGTDPGVMEKALDRIRDRVDALGVAEPDISLTGTDIQVQLPGLGGQGRVEKRGKEFCAVSAAGQTLGCFPKRSEAEARAKAQSVARVLQLIGTTARLEQREVKQTIAPSDAGYGDLQLTRYDPPRTDKKELVTYEDSDGDGRFTAGADLKYKLGPVEITGAALDGATATFIPAGQGTVESGWQVDFQMNSEGGRRFGDVTKRLQGKQLAILLDGIVQSAPTIEEPITGGRGQITGSFTEQEAKDLAVVLNSGALPVQLERQAVTTVSPTLGRESLRQGIVAGLAGLMALALYLAFYYRLLGVVTWFGMAVWGLLSIGLISALGATAGYSLTLAGVAGLIVSIGITADSYIVFYERLKDEVRQGKTVRTAVMPAFSRAWQTIIAADIVTITAAVVLYVLAVGSVRGFALTLGMATAMDMFVVYFFKRPTVFLVSRSPALSELRGFGLRSGVAAEPVPAVAGGSK